MTNKNYEMIKFSLLYLCFVFVICQTKAVHSHENSWGSSYFSWQLTPWKTVHQSMNTDKPFIYTSEKWRWNLTITQLKTNIIFQTSIFLVQNLNFPGRIVLNTSKNPSPTQLSVSKTASDKKLLAADASSAAMAGAGGLPDASRGWALRESRQPVFLMATG